VVSIEGRAVLIPCPLQRALQAIRAWLRPHEPCLHSAFLQWVYAQALITRLQHAPPVLSALLLLATTYKLELLEKQVRHAMHGALNAATSVGVYEVATLCDCQSLQIRALKVVMVSVLIFSLLEFKLILYDSHQADNDRILVRDIKVVNLVVAVLLALQMIPAPGQGVCRMPLMLREGMVNHSGAGQGTLPHSRAQRQGKRQVSRSCFRILYPVYEAASNCDMY